MRPHYLVFISLLPALVYGAITGPFGSRECPSVSLDKATVVGTTNGSVESFLAIPYAQPPIGDLRLRLPQLLTSYNGTINATAFGNQCLQQALTVPAGVPDEILDGIGALTVLSEVEPGVGESEDCLHLNVIRPANTLSSAKLPVVVWFYGGGFSGGSNALTAYNGGIIVKKSIDIGHPVIYVAMNYRLSVFGFLGGEEIKDAGIGNLGLRDQRAALQWVNKFISAFGGDPTKVTLWGDSAGAISVGLQMFVNGGNPEGLFRAAIMNSGSIVPTGNITEAQVQNNFNFVVSQVGCSGSSDLIACLRNVTVDSLSSAAALTPGAIGYLGLATPYEPRADGDFITVPPLQLPLQGEIADVPFIIGDVKDEGTSFSIGSLNVTTDDEFEAFIEQNWFPGASAADLAPILQLYPSDPAAGSPFDTGAANAFTPEYKRISALQGDWFFNAPRRVLLEKYSSRQTVYNFLSARGNFSGIGIAHSSDMLIAYGPGDMTEYWVRFISTLNPNPKTGDQWPRFNTSTRPTLQFNNGNVPLNITADTERLNGTDALSALSLEFPY